MASITSKIDENASDFTNIFVILLKFSETRPSADSGGVNSVLRPPGSIIFLVGVSLHDFQPLSRFRGAGVSMLDMDLRS